ncbi:MFS transporter [soil metagenome]
MPLSARDLVGATRPRTGFWIVAMCFISTTALGTVPTPLYRLYQQEGGYGDFISTIVFAVYAVGILAALIFAGHLSDLVGRRPVLMAATAMSVLSAVAFCLSDGVAGWLVARLLTGIGTGLMTATATAYLTDLNDRARPGQGNRVAEVTSTACNLGGLAAGGMLSGVVATHLPEPLLTPYLVALVLLITSWPLALLVPETIRRNPGTSYRIQLPSVPAERRRDFWGAALAGGLSFSITGLFASQAPSLIVEALGGDERQDLSGVLGTLVFGTAALAQILLARGEPRRQVLLALLLLVPGFVLAVGGCTVESLPLLFVGTVISGVASGLCLTGAVSCALQAAPESQRGQTLKGTFVVTYAGLIVPVVGFGSLTQTLGLVPALWWYAIFVVVMVAAIAVVLQPRKIWA